MDKTDAGSEVSEVILLINNDVEDEILVIKHE